MWESGMAQDLRRLADFNQKTTRENGETARHLLDHREIMRDKQIAETELVLLRCSTRMSGEELALFMLDTVDTGGAQLGDRQYGGVERITPERFRGTHQSTTP